MITQLNRVKEYNDIDTLTTEYDGILTNLACSVDSMIIRYLGSEVNAQNVEYNFISEYSQNTYLLPYIKINAITSVQYRQKPTDSYTTIGVNEYALLQNPYRLYYDTFVPGYEYKVALNVGYSDSSMPCDLIQCATEIVSIKFKESDVRAGKLEGRLGVKTINTQSSGGTANLTFEDVWEKWKRELSLYKVLP